MLMENPSKHHVNQERLDEERMIIDQAKKQPAAFEPLYRRYFEDIFRFIYQRVDSKDLAKDLTQQTFIKAMNALSNYEDRGLPFKSWLYRIALNELNSEFRKNSKNQCLNLSSEGIEEIMDEMEEHNNYEPYIERLTEVMGMLEPENLYLLEMRFFEKRSFKEIGEILEITENNAKVKTYRLLEKIKHIIIKAA